MENIGPHSGWANNALRWTEVNGVFSTVDYSAATANAPRTQTVQMLNSYLDP